MDYREKDARVGWYKYMFKLGPYWVQAQVLEKMKSGRSVYTIILER